MIRTFERESDCSCDCGGDTCAWHWRHNTHTTADQSTHIT